MDFSRKRANWAKNKRKHNHRHPTSEPETPAQDAPDQEAGQPHPARPSPNRPQARRPSTRAKKRVRKKFQKNTNANRDKGAGPTRDRTHRPASEVQTPTKPGSIHARTVRPTATTTFGLVARIPRPTASSAFEFRSQLQRQRVAEQPSKCPRDYHVTRETTSQKTTSFRFLFASATQMHHKVQDQWA